MVPDAALEESKAMGSSESRGHMGESSDAACIQPSLPSGLWTSQKENTRHGMLFLG